ncbi:MAG: DUF4153 domain-containing protein [Pseudomonadota bacterium]
MTTNEQQPHKLMVLVALLQGLSLLYLHQAIELDFWPNNQPQWLFAFYSVALALPVMLLLGLTRNNMARMMAYAFAFALLIGVLGYYVGSQAIPVQHIRSGSLLFGFALTISLATFKALMYAQQAAKRAPINYASLFRWSWRNFFTLALSLLFASCVWLILWLWGTLFKAIDIRFFDDLFKEPWFYYPTIALANGFGVILFRRLTHVIDTITRLQQALMKFLLVLLVFVSLLFLGALPFTGLASLWENGGSTLILWMQALILFFVSAVYQDDPKERPYAPTLHRFIYVGIALLPIYSAIAFYGLSLRIDQHGWSIARCWAVMVWLFLALFPLGYWWGIAKERDYWTVQLSRVNVSVGLLVLAAMLLVNSPLLDFRKIVVNSQIERLENGDIDANTLELRYFRQHLARPGYVALQALREKVATSNPALAMRINQSYRDRNDDKPVVSKEEFIAALTVLSEEAPPELLAVIYAKETEHPWRLENTEKYYVQSVDLNEDSQTEYLLLAQQQRHVDLTLCFLESGTWRMEGLKIASGRYLKDADRAAFVRAFIAGDFTPIRPKWNQLSIGDQIIRTDSDASAPITGALGNLGS